MKNTKLLGWIITILLLLIIIFILYKSGTLTKINNIGNNSVGSGKLINTETYKN